MPRSCLRLTGGRVLAAPGAGKNAFFFGRTARPAATLRAGKNLPLSPRLRARRAAFLPALALLLLLLLLAAACGGPEGHPAAGPPALPSLDLVRFEPAVRAQLAAAVRAAADHPGDADAAAELGKLLHAYGWLEDASACYERAVHFAPADYRWWYLLARASAENGRRDRAREASEQCARVEGGYLPVLLFLGDAALQDGDAAGADRWFQQALKVSPRSPQALFGAGEVRNRGGDRPGAIQLFLEALTIAPEYGSARYQLALAYRESGDAEGAAAQLSRYSTAEKSLPPSDPLLEQIQSIRRDSDHVFRQANAAFKKGDLEAALKLYQETQRLNPDLAIAEYNLGMTLEQLGKPEQAIERFQVFLRRRPDYADAHNNLGLCLVRLQRKDEAAASFTRALAADPGYYKAHFNLALLADRDGRPDAAMESLGRAIAIHPAYPEAYYQMALLLKRQKRGEDARRALVEVLRHRPDDDKAHAALRSELAPADRPQTGPESAGLACRRVGMLLREHRLFRAAVFALRSRDAAGDWRTAAALGWILATCPDAGVRRPAEAVLLLEPICRDAAPGDPVAHDALAAAYAAAGRFQDAIRTAGKALELCGRGGQAQVPPPELASRVELRLKLYQEGKSYVEE